MKKLNSSFYVILIVITAFCNATCGKDGSGGGGGNAVLLGDLIGFWQSGSDSFTFNGQDNKLGGTATVGGRSGDVNNSKFNNNVVTFDLVFNDDNSIKSYTGTLDASKKNLKLASSGTTTTFIKQ